VKIKVYLFCFLIAVLLYPGLINAQDNDPAFRLGLSAIHEAAIKAQLGFLASDWTEGRETGEKGEFLAADYIASMLQLYGVKPGGDYIQARGSQSSQTASARTYFQNFVLLKTMPGDDQFFSVKTISGNLSTTTDFTYNVDFTFRPAYPSVDTDAPVVFIGYGFKNDKLRFNDFGKLDIKGKFLLKISGIPSFARESLAAADLSNSVRDAEIYAREMGAAGIIEFNPTAVVAGNPTLKDFMNMSPSEGRVSTGRPYARYSIPGKTIPDNFLRLSVSARAAAEIFKGTGISIDEYIKKAGSGEPYAIPQMTGKSVSIKTSIKTSQVAVRNIIGVIEGTSKDQVIVLGAHYDHMGIGNGYLWNGADDNASGTVGVMTVAKAIMATGKKPEKTIIIALWTAEEQGLLGSRYYVSNLSYPLKDLKLNVNFDMISRYITDDKPKSVVMTYTSSCPKFKDITENNLKKFGIDLEVDFQPSDDPPGGTDHRSFVEAGIPVMRFKPGHREEYHTPGDEINTIDWDIMEKIIRISFANVWELANSSWQ
jgi:hypothetical protein